MKIFRLMMSVTLLILLFAQCQKDDLPQDSMKSAKKDGPSKGMFKVTIENV